MTPPPPSALFSDQSGLEEEREVESLMRGEKPRREQSAYNEPVQEVHNHYSDNENSKFTGFILCVVSALLVMAIGAMATGMFNLSNSVTELKTTVSFLSRDIKEMKDQIKK